MPINLPNTKAFELTCSNCVIEVSVTFLIQDIKGGSHTNEEWGIRFNMSLYLRFELW